MARTLLTQTIQKAYRIALMSIKTGIPIDELINMRSEPDQKARITRRQLLYTGLAAAGATAAMAFHQKPIEAQMSPVLIVGAGLAGLTVAYRLTQAGVPVQIIEGRNQVGGRIRTTNSIPGVNVACELGGEFINTNHTALRSLAKELGLLEIDLFKAQLGLTQEIFFFEGRRLSLTEIVQGFAPLAVQIQRDLDSLANFDSYKTPDANATRLDQLSLAEYLDRSPASNVVKQLIKATYTPEYGRDPEEQSCLNFLFFVGTDPQDFSLLGESDERYQIFGGNSQVIQKLTNIVGKSITLNTALEGIKSLPDGRYRVSLKSGGKTFDRTYERIILAIPFTTLRQTKLDVNLSPAKRLAISNLGYGTNSKLITGYRRRLWRENYQSIGTVYTDLGYQVAWEANPSQPGPNALISNLTGGAKGVSIGNGTPESQAQLFLSQHEKVFPGITANRIGGALVSYWPGKPFFLGSYQCYLPGQWTSIYGSEGEREGNLFFAGEHTSLEFGGFMEGACESGERVAIEILEDLGMTNQAAQMRSRLRKLKGDRPRGRRRHLKR